VIEWGMQPAVAVSDLTVVRGATQALRDVSLDVVGGRVTGLLGPSGSGKTTLMRAVVGVQIVAAGDVTVLGLPAGTPELRSRVGYVTQEPSVYADLTVHENLAYFARLLGAAPERVDAVIARVELGAEAGSVATALSGGQLARVSLAAALLNEPELMVLDEPTVGLDPVLRRDLWDFFHELALAGTTLLVSSHVMDEAERCDDLLLLREGRLLLADTPAGALARTGAASLDAAFLALIEGQS
jgi:ABC-2 type transport system ATP-binding protein